MIDLLETTKEAFANVRSSMVVAMQKLHQVREQGLWTQVASNWGEYVEAELGISQSFASKLLTVNKHYILEGGISPEKLAGIDYEKLYLARELTGTIEENVEKARTLSRLDLKQDKNDDTPHEHQIIQICKICNLRV